MLYKFYPSQFVCCGKFACLSEDCCNGTCYNHSTSTCCNGTVYPYVGYCCGSEWAGEISRDPNRWSLEQVKLEMCPQGQKCCQGGVHGDRYICYDPNTSTCCDSTGGYVKAAISDTAKITDLVRGIGGSPQTSLPINGTNVYPWRGICCGEGACREGESCCGDTCYDPKLYSCIDIH